MRKHFLLSHLSWINSASVDIFGIYCSVVDAGKPCSQWIDGCLTFEVREKLNRSAVEQNKDKCHEAEL